MASRKRVIDQRGVQERAARARAFLLVAEAAGEAPDSAGRAVAVSNAVDAAIAASDAICGRRLGEHAQGDDHDEAIALLRRAVPQDSATPNALRRLLSVKSRAQYGAGEFGIGLASENIDRARRIVDAMEAVLLEP